MILRSEAMLHVLRLVFVAILVSTVCSTWAAAEDWPQWRGPNRDGVWSETGLVEQFASDRLPIKWRAEIGSGYSGPTVAKGRVYVTDRGADPDPSERVLCFDEQTGKPLWKHAYPAEYGRIGYPAGPRAAVTVDAGKAYALGATGWLHCFDAASGQILWKEDLQAKYEIQMPMWGIAAAPLIFENLVILHIGGRNACLVALDKNDGREVWQALKDPGQYSAAFQ